MWSIGVITYILLCGFPPFYGDSMPLLFEQIMNGRYDYPEDYWGEVSQDAVDFIDHLLVVDKVSFVCPPKLFYLVSFFAISDQTNDCSPGASTQVAGR